MKGRIRNASIGGIAGTHAVVDALAVRVGPATAEGQRNVVATAVIPIACWRVEDVRFEFGSSFVLPDAADELGELKSLREEHAVPASGVLLFPPLSIFGHADPTGSDDYNKLLSGRRARAVYGLLTRDAALWESLFSKPHGDDAWGIRSIQIMLGALGIPTGESGKLDEPTRQGVRQFQTAQGLKADGDPGPNTRAKLFPAYMDLLCGPDFRLTPEDFLARGADAGRKGDVQGCSEFNPLLLFSQAEESAFAKSGSTTVRNAENGPNRRVMVLLFRPGSEVNPARWPCPRAEEGTAGCKKRFWSDGEQRRSLHLPAARRRFDETADTFGCRFYDRLSNNSPCERLVKRAFAAWDVVPLRPVQPGAVDAPDLGAGNDPSLPNQKPFQSEDVDV